MKAKFIYEALENSIIVYHGSGNKLELDSIEINRENLVNIDQKGTGSKGYGFYVTKDLWDNSRDNDKRIFQSLYKEGTKGNQSAEKYAQWSFDKTKKAYIYKIELNSNIKLKYNNDANVTKEELQEYIKAGYDGLSDKNEGVIFNKEKIKSLKLIYYADDFMIEVAEFEKGKINHDNAKIIPQKYLNVLLKKSLGETYKFAYKTKKENYPVYWDNLEDAKKAMIVMRFQILDWKKIK